MYIAEVPLIAWAADNAGVLLPYCLVQHVCQAFFNPAAVDICARPRNKGHNYASGLYLFVNGPDIPALP